MNDTDSTADSNAQTPRKGVADSQTADDTAPPSGDGEHADSPEQIKENGGPTSLLTKSGFSNRRASA